jgi:transcription factor IIIB subunit 2
LNEFAETPSGDLSIDQFRSTDLSTEANPPSYHIPNRTARRAEDNVDDLDEREIEQEMQEALSRPDLMLLAPIITNPDTWINHAVDEDPSQWSDLDDDELDSFILSEEEKAIKTEIWEEMNQDWLIEQECRFLFIDI